MNPLRLRSLPSTSRFVAAAIFTGAPLFASEIVHTTTIPEQPVPYSQIENLPKFDPALGILRQVEITVSGSAYGSFGIENTNASPGSTPLDIAALVFVGLPNTFMSPPNPAFEYESPTLAAFDGTIDYGGASGISGNFAGATGTGMPSMTVTLFQTPEVAFYVGPSGSPGTFPVQIVPKHRTVSGMAPGFQPTHTLAIRVVVRVRYTYDPLPTTFCYSASWDGCPCGNTGSPGHGCAHSLDLAGGLLSFGGVASLANDTLFLQGSSMTNSVALYFQGSSMDYVGTVYGDGLSCVGGALVRLGLVQNSAGTSTMPSGGPSLSVRGGITTPGTRAYYQAQYRNALPFCTLATFNATNAVAVEWGP